MLKEEAHLGYSRIYVFGYLNIIAKWISGNAQQCDRRDEKHWVPEQAFVPGPALMYVDV